MPRTPRTSAERKRAERVGRRAEGFVALYLRLTGHSILARNYRCRSGEIDIIARRWRTIVFIEVKQRSRAAHAVEPVTARSERRIMDASEVWMNTNPIHIGSATDIRYDIVTLVGWRVGHLKNAFRGW